MSLSLLGSILDLTALVVTVAWVFSFVSATLSQGFATGVTRWRKETADLRGEDPLYPILLFVGLYAFMWALAVVSGASFAQDVLQLAPFVVGFVWLYFNGTDSIRAFIGQRRATDIFATPTDFALPMEIYDSPDPDVGLFDSGIHVPRRTLLTLGASGSGKSETLKHFASDILGRGVTAPTVIYDHKQDYEEFIHSRSGGTDDMLRVSARGSDVRWNIFAEMREESDADEIARSLFPSGSNDEFFGTAGRQLFAANLKYLYREMESPDNADLVRYWERANAEKMYDNLTRDGHEDLTAAASAIDPEAGRQAAGVFATAQQRVNDIFVGDFADSGAWSVREYMENPQGRALVLSRDARQGETTAPIFAYLLDKAIEEGMAAPTRQAYYFLDEVEHMGVRIRRLGELINVGRGARCQCLLSLQSVGQLYDTYGKERGQALLSGMSTAIILRTTDQASVEYARERIGTHFTEYTGHTERDQHGAVTERETRFEEEHDFSRGDFARFDPGEAVVARDGKAWVFGRIRLLRSDGD